MRETAAPVQRHAVTASFFFLEVVLGPSWAVCMDVGGQFSGTATGINPLIAFSEGGVFRGRRQRLSIQATSLMAWLRLRLK